MTRGRIALQEFTRAHPQLPRDKAHELSVVNAIIRAVCEQRLRSG